MGQSNIPYITLDMILFAEASLLELLEVCSSKSPLSANFIFSCSWLHMSVKTSEANWKKTIAYWLDCADLCRLVQPLTTPEVHKICWCLKFIQASVSTSCMLTPLITSRSLSTGYLAISTLMAPGSAQLLHDLPWDLLVIHNILVLIHQQTLILSVASCSKHTKIVKATPKPASLMAHSTVTRALVLWAHI